VKTGKRSYSDYCYVWSSLADLLNGFTDNYWLNRFAHSMLNL